MSDQTWSLQDAKNQFSAVVEAALHGHPQWVTRRGKPVSVMLSVERYQHLMQLEKAAAPGFGQLLLDMPQDDSEIEPLQIIARDLEF